MHQAMAEELERALDTDAAIANLRKAAALDPKLPGIHYELAEALQQANDEKLRTEAETQYKRALDTAEKTGGPNTTAGARTSASPTTPPSPVGSGQVPL